MFAVKDEIIRDEGPHRDSLCSGCSAEAAGSDCPGDEVEQCGAPHAVIKRQLLFLKVQ